MKFRNPETGEIFNSILLARANYCEYPRKTCANCSIQKRRDKWCSDWICEHAREAARLMGYEVVEDAAPTLKDAIDKYLEIKQEEDNMDKPLKDWTLGEIKNYCEKHDCTKDCPCSASNGECKINRVNPCEWDLEENPRFTEQDVEDAKAVKRVFGRDGTVKRLNKAITDPYSNLTFDHMYINERMFPCIFEGQEYTLDEIIGGAV